MKPPMPIATPAPFGGDRHNATAIEQAIGLAREYARPDSAGAKRIQLRDAIFGLVGSWDADGREVLPEVVANTMDGKA